MHSMSKVTGLVCLSLLLLPLKNRVFFAGVALSTSHKLIDGISSSHVAKTYYLIY